MSRVFAVLCTMMAARNVRAAGDLVLWDYCAEGQQVKLVLFGSGASASLPCDGNLCCEGAAKHWQMMGMIEGYSENQAFHWAIGGWNGMWEAGFYTDFGSEQLWGGADIGKSDCHGAIRMFRLRYKSDWDDEWKEVDLTDTEIAEGRGSAAQGVSAPLEIGDAEGGQFKIGQTLPSDRNWQNMVTFGKPFKARYIRMEVGEYECRANCNAGWAKWRWYTAPVTTTTLTVTTTTVTATTKTSTTESTTTTIEGHNFYTVYTELEKETTQLKTDLAKLQTKLDDTKSAHAAAITAAIEAQALKFQADLATQATATEAAIKAAVDAQAARHETDLEALREEIAAAAPCAQFESQDGGDGTKVCTMKIDRVAGFKAP